MGRTIRSRPVLSVIQASAASQARSLSTKTSVPQRVQEAAAIPATSGRSRRSFSFPVHHAEPTGSRSFTTMLHGSNPGSQDLLTMGMASFLPGRSSNQTKFHIITGSHLEGQGNGFVQNVLERLRRIIGDVSSRDAETEVVRTPLRILPAASHPHGGNVIAFQVYNASQEQSEEIVHSLEDLPEVHSCGYERSSPQESN